MNLSEQLASQKNKLKTCDTRISFADGTTYVESKTGLKLQSTTNPGFVVDTKPDLRLSQIIENVYLGSQDVAYDLNILTNNKITHILNVSTGVLNLYEGWFVYHNVKALDVPEFSLLEYFDDCSNFIEEALRVNGRVLVHCNAGVSRSAAVVIAYLMKTLKLGYEDAFDAVKQKRSFIRPNVGFVQQLKAYDRKLKSGSL